MRARARRVLRYFTPYGIVARQALSRDIERERVDRSTAARAMATRSEDFSVEDAVRFMVSRGLDEEQVRQGSMPRSSLAFVSERLEEALPNGQPLFAVHVGNFVGISLGFFTALLRDKHPDSVVVSIDPNVNHRGIDNPNGHVIALLERHGLLSNSLIIPGYTLEQNRGYAQKLEQDDPLHVWRTEAACEQVLANLAALCGRKFDLVLLDGHHSGGYLERELTAARQLLNDGGVLAVDDVTAGKWEGVVRAFEAAQYNSEQPLETLGQDGRVGILKVPSA